MRIKNYLIFLILLAAGVVIYSGCSASSNSVRYNEKPDKKEGKSGAVRFTSEDDNKKAIEMLRAHYDRIDKEGQFHIQKVGLLRFNPFKDTGGDQSFILSLVDNNDTGVIISGLYSRSGVRWYAKKVAGGKGVEHELSEEERKALKEASNIK